MSDEYIIDFVSNRLELSQLVPIAIGMGTLSYAKLSNNL